MVMTNRDGKRKQSLSKTISIVFNKNLFCLKNSKKL